MESEKKPKHPDAPLCVYLHSYSKDCPQCCEHNRLYCECGRTRSACVGGFAKNRNTLHGDK